MIPLDYHIHSRYSEDGDASLEAFCEQAISLSIPEIGFSEHWDVGPYEKNPRFFQVELWYEEIEMLRSKYSGRLTIRAGVEIAEPHLYPIETQEVLHRASFDFVLGSVHFNGNQFLFDEDYFRNHSADEVYSSYFSELGRMIETADIDIVAHLDIPARTGKPILGYEPSRYEKQIRGILERIIHRGLALDINTGGMRKPAALLMPDPVILKWFKEMGGEQLTLGSDAHKVTQLGMHLNRAIKTLQETGLINITHFEKRRTSFSPLQQS